MSEYDDLQTALNAVRAKVDSLPKLSENQYRSIRDYFDLILYEAQTIMIRTEREEAIQKSKNDFYNAGNTDAE